MKKYFICEKKDGQIEIKTEILEKEFKEILNYTQNLQYYTLSRYYRDIALKNGNDLKEYLYKISNTTSIKEITRLKTTNIGIEINRLTLNYVVSTRTFVDNIEKIYIKKINKEKEFKANVLNKIYDTEEIYAFFYQLRNYAAHYNLVMDNIIFNKDSIHVYASKEHFLEYDGWNAKNKEFLLTCPENIDFSQYIEKMQVIIMSIFLAFLSYFADELQKIHNNIMCIMKKYQIITPCLMETNNNSSIEGAEIYELGLDVLKEATDEFSKLDNVNIEFKTEKDVLG